MQRTSAVLAMLAALAGLALSPGAGLRQAHAQAANRTVTCASDNNRYRECPTGFRGRAQVYRNLSDTACQEGRNWGSRDGVVWVNGGCRATFIESRGGWGGDQGPGPGGNGSVRCESTNNRYRECPSPFRGRAVIRRQLSDTRCTEGQSWGQRRGAIWVDDGCRAEFTEAGGWGSNSNYIVSCSSSDNRYRTCTWDRRMGAPTLIQQMSDTPCRQGQSWGWTRDQLWVDRGCRGRFGPR